MTPFSFRKEGKVIVVADSSKVTITINEIGSFNFPRENAKEVHKALGLAISEVEHRGKL